MKGQNGIWSCWRTSGVGNEIVGGGIGESWSEA